MLDDNKNKSDFSIKRGRHYINVNSKQDPDLIVELYKQPSLDNDSSQGAEANDVKKDKIKAKGKKYGNRYVGNDDSRVKPADILTYFYFPFSILLMEIVLKLSCGFSVAKGFLFTFLFTIPFALIMTLLCTIFKNNRVNRILATVFSAVFAIWYSAQLLYNNVFGTFFVINSLTNGGTGQAFNSIDMIMTAIFSRIWYILLMFVPMIINIVFGKRLFSFKRIKISTKLILVIIAISVQALSVWFVGFDSELADSKSNSNLYYGELQQNSACERFGVFTMQRIDIGKLWFGYKTNIKSIKNYDNANVDGATSDTAVNTFEKKPQVIKTDFKKLLQKTDNEDLQTLYDYFDNEQPSYTNRYTGMFKDYNIIFITAESFSEFAIDKELTPTLYKMYSEGFQFENYYSPAWGVSTTDGEYANLTGLIPKSGVWSFSKAAEMNVSLPFTLSEQCRAKKYEKVNAYHNHTYDYYDRDQYLTNIGYDYKAIGKGLDLGEDVWPNSDLKMMQKTVSEYINAKSFCTYYMSVSGHGGYSYNTISQRNFNLVKDLKYSDEVKGYLAANIELDRAVEYLLNELKKVDKLDNTLICITDDHYPYSLDEFKGLDELKGHKVDTTFERFENSWILWSASMKEPVKVDTYCSSIDVLPTMLNMLGFEYDSRLLSGTDVFGKKQPFVVFADRSWISQNGRYNANTGKYTQFKDAKGKDDIDTLNNKCTNMFSVSRMILDTNIYTQIYGDTHIVGN